MGKTADLSTSLRFGRDDKGKGRYRPWLRSGDGKPQISPLRSPGFPVKARGFDGLHAALFTESRTRSRCRQREVGNPAALRSR